MPLINLAVHFIALCGQGGLCYMTGLAEPITANP